jgi:uncharacterized protein
LTAPFSYLSPKTEVRAAPEKGGFAVFACQPLEKDELICVWTGQVVTYEAMLSLSEEDKSHTLQVDEGMYLAPLTPQVEPADCVNHSCAPNAGIRGQISLVAMRPITAGEEITFDYAMADSSPFDEFPCSCGTPTCRGRVTGSDWQRPELWARYQGYFSLYLERKIQALREEK